MNTQKHNKRHLLTFLLLMFFLNGYSQTNTTKFEKTMNFKSSATEKVFLIANINGDIEIYGHSSNDVKITAETQVDFTNEDGDSSKEKINIATMEKGDTIIVYIKGDCAIFGYDNCSDSKFNYGWRYNWNNCNNCNKCTAKFRFNFKVYLPADTHVSASTINKGQVHIEKVTGPITAKNINGGINLEEISNQTHANTINGDIDITYVKNPTKFSSYYSLNGDINAQFIKDFSADITFKSFNGELFTNVKELELMPNEITKQTNKRGLNFKIEEKKKIKFRSGGPLLDFETFNGDVYIKE